MSKGDYSKMGDGMDLGFTDYIRQNQKEFDEDIAFNLKVIPPKLKEFYKDIIIYK
jgi:hypothetical protein